MPLNILLADDSIPAQNMAGKILTEAGYHVRTVSNGLEALRKIADTVPDIAILDIFMPGYTGLELCERLRASAATASLPVILTVGRLEPYRPEDGEHVHANAVIVKPFAAAELIAAVRSLIGTPPPEVVAAPAPAAEKRAADTDDDPLQESYLAATPQPLAHATSADEHERVSDDVLFSYRESASPADGVPWAVAEPSTDESELLVSGEGNVDGPESLVFNPDATPTPFSASVIDSLPSEAQFSADNVAPAFSEFEMEPEASHDPFVPELESATKVTAFSAAAGAGQIGLSTTTTAGGAGEAPVFLPESDIAFSTPPLQEIAPTLDVLSLDDGWLELPESAASDVDVLMPPLPKLGEAAEEISSEIAPMSTDGAEVALTSEVGQPENDEEKRLAFEALFNTSEPFPVEEFYTTSAEVSNATLPSMADLSMDHSGEGVVDSEFESLIESDHGFVSPELDPFLMHEEDARGAASRIPERDVLLDNAFEPDWSGTESALEETHAAPANSREIDSPFNLQSPPPVGLGESIPAPLFETEPAAGQLAAIEALPAVTETSHEWPRPAEAKLPETPSAEIAEPNFEHLPAQLEPPEILYPEAQRTELEAVPPEPEMPDTEPTPVQEPEPEAPPVREPEPQPAPVPPEKVSMELTESRPDDAAEIPPPSLLSAPLDENERIHQAVDRVFDRFKRLLVTAIVRELARHD